MDERQVSMFVRSVSGSTFKVLFMMLFMDRSTGPAELSVLTGMSAWTCERSLLELEYLEAAQRHARVNGWMLTAKARQMALEFRAGSDAPEVKANESEHRNSMLGSSSSSLSCLESKCDGEPETTPPERRNSTLAEARRNATDEDAEAAVALLVKARCPERTARGKGGRDSVEAAIRGGWSGEEVLTAVEGWLAYADTPQGRWITHSGFLTGARIRRLERPPEEDRDARSRRYLQETLAARGLTY